MKRPNWVLLIIATLLFIPTFIGIAKWVEFEQNKVITIANYTYEGKVIMDADEYAKFKAIVARSDVIIRNLEVFSSENPLVIFKVDTPPDIGFFWGNRTVVYKYSYSAPKWEQDLYCGWLTLGCGIPAFSFLFTSFMIRYGR